MKKSMLLLSLILSVHSPAAINWNPQNENDCVYAYEFFRGQDVDMGGNITSTPNQCSGSTAIAALGAGAVPVPLVNQGPGNSNMAIFDGGTMLPAASSVTNLVSSAVPFTACQVRKFTQFNIQNIMLELRDVVAPNNVMYFYFSNANQSWGLGGEFADFAGSRFMGITEDITSFHKDCLIYNGAGWGVNSNFSFYRDGVVTQGSLNDVQGGSYDAVFGNYINANAPAYKASAQVSGFWFWNHQLNANALNKWSNYINHWIGL